MPEIKPFDPLVLALIAVLNPAVIAVGIIMGRAADQWQKLIVAAFAAAIAGAALVWLGTLVGLLSRDFVRIEAGLFVAQLVPGFIWAAIGYALRRKSGE